MLNPTHCFDDISLELLNRFNLLFESLSELLEGVPDDFPRDQMFIKLAELDMWTKFGVAQHQIARNEQTKQ